MKDVLRLIEACCWAYDNPAWRPKDDDPKTPQNERTTYCNFAVNYVCKFLDYNGFDRKPWPLTANEIIQKMKSNVAVWMPISMGFAQSYANQGSLVIACQADKPHGHVCIIRPGIETYSGKWGKNVPVCMNVGAVNSIAKGINFVFAKEPEFYVWTGSL